MSAGTANSVAKCWEEWTRNRQCLARPRVSLRSGGSGRQLNGPALVADGETRPLEERQPPGSLLLSYCSRRRDPCVRDSGPRISISRSSPQCRQVGPVVAGTCVMLAAAVRPQTRTLHVSTACRCMVLPLPAAGCWRVHTAIAAAAAPAENHGSCAIALPVSALSVSSPALVICRR